MYRDIFPPQKFRNFNHVSGPVETDGSTGALHRFHVVRTTDKTSATCFSRFSATIFFFIAYKYLTLLLPAAPGQPTMISTHCLYRWHDHTMRRCASYQSTRSQPKSENSPTGTRFGLSCGRNCGGIGACWGCYTFFVLFCRPSGKPSAAAEGVLPTKAWGSFSNLEIHE